MKKLFYVLILSSIVLSCSNFSNHFEGVYISSEQESITQDKSNVFFGEQKKEYNLVIIEELNDSKYKITNYGKSSWDGTRTTEEIVFDKNDDGTSLNYKNGEIQIIKNKDKSISVFYNGKSEEYVKTKYNSSELNEDKIQSIIKNGIQNIIDIEKYVGQWVITDSKDKEDINLNKVFFNIETDNYGDVLIFDNKNKLIENIKFSENDINIIYNENQVFCLKPISDNRLDFREIGSDWNFLILSKK